MHNRGRTQNRVTELLWLGIAGSMLLAATLGPNPVAAAGTDHRPVATLLSTSGGTSQSYADLAENHTLKLDRDETIRIGWFKTGRIEVWSGPGKLEVGAVSGIGKKATLIGEAEFGTHVGTIWQRVSDVRNQTGNAEEVRGKTEELARLTDREQADVAAKRESCEKVRGQSVGDYPWDADHCLYLLLLEYSQCTEAQAIIESVTDQCDCAAPFDQIPYCPIIED